jgi:hypothetical protein
MNNRKYDLKLKLGIYKLQDLEVTVVNGALVGTPEVKLVLDCTYNNDLVDFFKTLLEGCFEIDCEEFDLKARFEVYHLLR